MIHTVKGFGVVSKAEVDFFLELSCLFYDPTDVGSLSTGEDVEKLEPLHTVSGSAKQCSNYGI